MIPSANSTNRLALVSFISATLTLLAFCVGFAPIPLTAWVCYPAAILLGVVDLLTGFKALRQVRTSGEKGRYLTYLAIWIGALTILGVLCFSTLSFVFLFYGAETIKTIWPHFNL